MGDKTKIEWTDATWNPVIGCTKVSAGCKLCYWMPAHDRRHAAWQAGRWPDAPRQYHQPSSVVQMMGERIDQPLRWQRPRRVFVNSLSDLFNEEIPAAFIADVFATMALAARHTFQVLTKRPERMRAWVAGEGRREVVLAMRRKIDPARNGWAHFSPGTVRHACWIDSWAEKAAWPLPNVWLGTSVEDQRAADERIPHLLAVPAAVRFLSCEPLLGAVDFGQKIDWVICGGESDTDGKSARPMHPDWARSLRDQCAAARVPFFFKQWGEHAPHWHLHGAPVIAQSFDPDFARKVREKEVLFGSTEEAMVRVGKKRAGRLLDGREWNEMPATAKEVAV